MPFSNSELLEKIDAGEKFSAEKNDAAYKKIRKSKSIYIDQLICLLAVAGMAVWRNGWRAVIIMAISVLCCIVLDIVCCRLSRKVYNPKDLSTITTGFCLALMMPSGINYHIVIFAAAMAMSIKHIFGGKDNYIFSPAAVSIAFLIICFPSKMLQFPSVGEILPLSNDISVTLQSGIENYLMKNGTAQPIPLLDILTGNFVGAMGTTHILVLAVCAVCLVFRRALSPIVTLTGISVCALISLVFPVYENVGETMVLELIGGYFLFGFVFLANDPQTVPKSWLGKFYYGAVLGTLIMVFRYFGKVEGSFVFALLVANVLALHIDSFAQHTINGFRRIGAFAGKSRTSFERMRENAKDGKTPDISDTQEIIVPPTNFNMPPIDNKVSKISRKKSGIGAKIGVFFAIIAKPFVASGSFVRNIFKKKSDADDAPKKELTQTTDKSDGKAPVPDTKIYGKRKAPTEAEKTAQTKETTEKTAESVLPAKAKKSAQNKDTTEKTAESVLPVKAKKPAQTKDTTEKTTESVLPAKAKKPAQTKDTTEKAAESVLPAKAKKPAQTKDTTEKTAESVLPAKAEKPAQTKATTEKTAESVLPAKAKKPAQTKDTTEKAPESVLPAKAKKPAQTKDTAEKVAESVLPTKAKKPAQAKDTAEKTAESVLPAKAKKPAQTKDTTEKVAESVLPTKAKKPAQTKATTEKTAESVLPTKAKKPAQTKATTEKTAESVLPAKAKKPAQTKDTTEKVADSVLPTKAKKPAQTKDTTEKAAESVLPAKAKKPAQTKDTAEKTAESVLPVKAKKPAQTKDTVTEKTAESVLPVKAKKPAQTKDTTEKAPESVLPVKAKKPAQTKDTTEKTAESVLPVKSKKPAQTKDTAEKTAESVLPAKAKKPAQTKDTAEKTTESVLPAKAKKPAQKKGTAKANNEKSIKADREGNDDLISSQAEDKASVNEPEKKSKKSKK